jgi:hypothetical protein
MGFSPNSAHCLFVSGHYPIVRSNRMARWVLEVDNANQAKRAPSRQR